MATTDPGTAGNIAHDAVDSGNPVKIGGYASSASPAVVAAGDRVDQWYSLRGALVIAAHAASGADGQSTVINLLDAADGSAYLLGTLPHLFTGAGEDRERTPNVFKSIASTSVTAGSPVAGWTPASGKKFRLMGYALSLSVAGSVVLQDATTEKIRTPLMPAGIGQPSPAMGNGILSAAANNSLNLDVTATGTVSGFLFGTEE